MPTQSQIMVDIQRVAKGKLTAKTAKTPQQKKLAELFDTNFLGFQKLRERVEADRHARIDKLRALEQARKERDAAASQPAAASVAAVDLGQEQLEGILREVLARARGEV